MTLRSAEALAAQALVMPCRLTGRQPRFSLELRVDQNSRPWTAEAGTSGGTAGPTFASFIQTRPIAKYARDWCEAASRIKPPSNLSQPQERKYVLLSEKTFGRHGQAGFDALLGAWRMELETLLAIGSGRLF